MQDKKLLIKTEDTLMELGVKSSRVGFIYICDAMQILKKSPKTRTIDLYMTIANEECTTWAGVERAIRCAIETIKDDTLTEYFGKNFEKTNTNFLKTLAIKIRREMEE